MGLRVHGSVNRAGECFSELRSLGHRALDTEFVGGVRVGGNVLDGLLEMEKKEVKNEMKIKWGEGVRRGYN